MPPDPSRALECASRPRCPLPWVAGLAIFLSLVCTACHRETSAAPGMPPAPVVTVEPVRLVDVVEFDEFPARLDSKEIVEIRPRVSG